MTPALLTASVTKLELNDWDRDLLKRLRGRARVFEPLRTAIESLDYKAEQEPSQRDLYALFASKDRSPAEVGAASGGEDP